MIFLAHTANYSPRVISSIMVLAYCFVVTKAKFLLHQELSSVSNFHLLIAVATIKVMNLLVNRGSWLLLLRLPFFLVNGTKCFVLPLVEDLSVRSKYCLTSLLENKWSSTRRISSSANAIKTAKLSFMLLRFLTANTCRFHLCLICRRNFSVIRYSVSGESRTFQVWLDVTLWNFQVWLDVTLWNFNRQL